MPITKALANTKFGNKVWPKKKNRWLIIFTKDRFDVDIMVKLNKSRMRRILSEKWWPLKNCQMH